MDGAIGFLWLLLFLLLGAGLTALIFLTHVMPSQEQAKEALSKKQADILKERLRLEKERRDRKLLEDIEKARKPRDSKSSIAQANDLIDGDDK